MSAPLPVAVGPWYASAIFWAIVAGVAAVAGTIGTWVALIAPWLQARKAAAHRQEQIFGRVEVRGSAGRLPQVREVSDAQLRVHASRIEVPYIARDQQAEVDEALLARQALLIVGHSMAGKTRAAA